MKHALRRYLVAHIIILCHLLLAAGIVYAEEELSFPLRGKYSQLAIIDTNTLAGIYDSALIIDARDSMEYNVLHMDKAQNIHQEKMSEGDLLAMRAKDDATPIIFYCNGTTCPKSYKAGEMAVRWGFKNIKVFDSGIFYWAKKHPEHTVFFGQALTPESMKTNIIPDEKFQSRLLSTKDFIAKANSGQFTVIDSRDYEEILETPIHIDKLRTMSIDMMAKLLLKKSWVMPRENILVFDSAAQQTRWLQYYFEKEEVKNYYFLQGGVRQWLADGYDNKGNHVVAGQGK